MSHLSRPCLFVVAVLAVAAGRTTLALDTVPQYGTYELKLPMETVDSGDWVSDTGDVCVRMTCPSGRTVESPVYLTRDFTTEPFRGAIPRSAVSLLKIYFDETEWETPGHIDCLLSDVRLADSRSETEVLLAGEWTGIACGLDVIRGAGPDGEDALRLDIDLARPPQWPGALLETGGADWSEYDELRFSMKLETTSYVGPACAEFVTSSGQKVKAGWDLFGYAPSGEWGEYVWRFREPVPKTEIRTVPAGPTHYAARLMPGEPGLHTVDVIARGRSVSDYSFECVASGLPRPVRVSRADPSYFETVDGRPWLAIGENVCWYGGGKLEDYEAWLARLHAAGANYCRIWMPPWCFALEWETLGDYRLDRAWELDRVLELARSYDIRVMLCFEWHGSYRKKDSWWDNPYNSENGGPCAIPRAFFTDGIARDMFRRRVAYIAARYSAYANILSWEFFNEVDLIDGYDSRVVARWHDEMAGFLRGIDPYNHLITTSYSGARGDERVWGLSGIEYVQAHDYTKVDWGQNGRRWVEHYRQRHRKPMLFGEAGIDHSGEKTAEMDPAGIHLHNALWSTVAGGGAGTAMTWWWDSYVHPEDLYHHFESVADFTADVNWTQGLRPVHSPQPLYEESSAQWVRGVVQIASPNRSWDPAPFNESNTFVVSSDGTVSDEDRLSRILHGVQNHPDLHNPHTFVIDCPAEAEFIIELEGVSGWGGAALQVTVDGEVVLDETFYDYRGGRDTIHSYDGPYTVELNPGRHEIVVSNPGADWVELDYLIIADWLHETPPVRVVGLAGPQDVIIWLQNRSFNRQLVREYEIAPAELRGVLLDMPDVPVGDYAVTVYDTWEGRILSRGRIVDGPTSPLRLPPFSRALALRLHRLDP
jgi:hypothetical protein